MNVFLIANPFYDEMPSWGVCTAYFFFYLYVFVFVLIFYIYIYKLGGFSGMKLCYSGRSRWLIKDSQSCHFRRPSFHKPYLHRPFCRTSKAALGAISNRMCKPLSMLWRLKLSLFVWRYDQSKFRLHWAHLSWRLRFKLDLLNKHSYLDHSLISSSSPLLHKAPFIIFEVGILPFI